jgi:hypothetical protein
MAYQILVPVLAVTCVEGWGDGLIFDGYHRDWGSASRIWRVAGLSFRKTRLEFLELCSFFFEQEKFALVLVSFRKGKNIE